MNGFAHVMGITITKISSLIRDIVVQFNDIFHDFNNINDKNSWYLEQQITSSIIINAINGFIYIF